MKPVILYCSQTGFTKQYAVWMAEELSCPAVPFEKRNTVDFSRYDTILFGSWCHGGRLKRMKWFRGMLPEWKGKRKLLFAVGASPAGNRGIEEFLKGLEAQEEGIRAFYLPGGLCYEQMGAVSRAMMKLFSFMIGRKREKTPEEENMARMIRRSYDISDRACTAPILEAVRKGETSRGGKKRREGAGG